MLRDAEGAQVAVTLCNEGAAVLLSNDCTVRLTPDGNSLNSNMERDDTQLKECVPVRTELEDW